MIPDKIRASHILKAIEEIRGNGYPPEHSSTGYDLVYEGLEYPPKYVISLAHKYLAGEVFNTGLFSGGIETNNFLTNRGFTTREKFASTRETKEPPRIDWSDHEVFDTVSIYLMILKLQLNRKIYNKTEFRKRLLPKLTNRTDGAIEFKFENISAVLIENHLPYIEGYKPRFHYQSALADIVVSAISNDKEFPSLVAGAADQAPNARPELKDIADVLVNPPERRLQLQPRQMQAWQGMRQPVDYVAREESNRRLGVSGEEFVMEFQKKRLSKVGHQELADTIEWVSKTRGDGLGYDILSYCDVSKPMFIEVKTTTQGIYFPFLASAREVDVSAELNDFYRIYRVFDFSKRPRLFILEGSFKNVCNLRPLTYEARL